MHQFVTHNVNNGHAKGVPANEAGYYKTRLRGGVDERKSTLFDLGAFLGVLVIISERRLEFTSPKKISIENVV